MWAGIFFIQTYALLIIAMLCCLNVCCLCSIANLERGMGWVHEKTSLGRFSRVWSVWPRVEGRPTGSVADLTGAHFAGPPGGTACRGPSSRATFPDAPDPFGLPFLALSPDSHGALNGMHLFRPSFSSKGGFLKTAELSFMGPHNGRRTCGALNHEKSLSHMFLKDYCCSYRAVPVDGGVSRKSSLDPSLQLCSHCLLLLSIADWAGGGSSVSSSYTLSGGDRTFIHTLFGLVIYTTFTSLGLLYEVLKTHWFLIYKQHNLLGMKNDLS